MKVHEQFSESLLEHGVDVVFGLMGDANLAYLAGYMDRGGRFVTAAHEANAVGMGDGWSRRTGRVGVVSLTHGPALTNALTNMVEAVRANSQLVIITGSTPLEPTHFQRMDLSATAITAGAGFEVVTKPENVVRHLSRAMQRTVAERRPIVLDLPIWMLDAEAGKQRAVALPQSPAPQTPDLDSLDDALGILVSSPRPIILAGRGAHAAGARDALIELAERVGGALATTLWAQGMFDGHPSNIGIYGNLAHPVGSGAIGEATCVVAFGASLNPLTTYRGELTRGKQIIQVDSDPGRFGWFIGVDAPVAADALATAAAMNEALEEIGHEPVSSWVGDVQKALAARDPRDDFQDLSRAETIDVRRAAVELNAVLPSARTLVHDVGRYIRGTLTYLVAPGPQNIVGMGAFGSIGLGLAGAIGASVAAPDEVTVLVVGDGGLMQYFTELSSAVREKLPLVLLVFNDGAYGAEYDKLEAEGADPKYSYQIWPDFVDVARAMGAQALSVRSVDDIAEVGKLAGNLSGPLLVDIHIDPTILG